MEKYNYYNAIRNDILEWLECEEFDPADYDESEDWLHDELWDDDHITGNGGGYYADESTCEEYLCHNLDLLMESMLEFGLDYNDSKRIYELIKSHEIARYCDCLIRCYLLSSVIPEALDKYYKKKGFNEQ